MRHALNTPHLAQVKIDAGRLKKLEKQGENGDIGIDSQRQNLIIERIEKSSYTVFWDGKKFESPLSHRPFEGGWPLMSWASDPVGTTKIMIFALAQPHLIGLKNLCGA